MKTLWCKNQENPSDRISHARAPLSGKAAFNSRKRTMNSAPADPCTFRLRNRYSSPRCYLYINSWLLLEAIPPLANCSCWNQVLSSVYCVHYDKYRQRERIKELKYIEIIHNNIVKDSVLCKINFKFFLHILKPSVVLTNLLLH